MAPSFVLSKRIAGTSKEIAVLTKGLLLGGETCAIPWCRRSGTSWRLPTLLISLGSHHFNFAREKSHATSSTLSVVRSIRHARGILDRRRAGRRAGLRQRCGEREGSLRVLH